MSKSIGVIGVLFSCFIITVSAKPLITESAKPIAIAKPSVKAERPQHIVVVIEENRPFKQIIGNQDAPFINRLARHNLLLTHSHAIRHPSEPNYLALFSGSTHGVKSDACPYHFSSPNLASELLKKGLSFASYSETMPSIGFTGCASGAYHRKHNPMVNWQGANVPARLNKRWRDFPTHYRKLPTVAFVIPNQNHDMHDGSINEADRWLKSHLSNYIAWAKHHQSWFILTFDEGNGSRKNHIVTIIAGAGIPASRCGRPVNHYSILLLLENLYDLPHLGKSQHAPAVTCKLSTPAT